MRKNPVNRAQGPACPHASALNTPDSAARTATTAESPFNIVSPSTIASRALPASEARAVHAITASPANKLPMNLERIVWRSEEHTSELQSQSNLVCRLLLETKNKPRKKY